MMTKHKAITVSCLLALSSLGAWGQEDASERPSRLESMDHSRHSMPAAEAPAAAPMDHAQPRSAPAPEQRPTPAEAAAGDAPSAETAEELEPRDPHAYSGGYDLGPYELRLADTHRFGSLLVDNFEAVRADGETSAAYDVQAWYGGTYDRITAKAEGTVEDGEPEEARTELLWSHAIASFWDTQLGLRYDSGEGPNRTWLAFGVQGLAPYWFEVEATGYIGEEGRTALRLEAEYELLLTQRLILQPRVEAELYGKRDLERGIGSGLSELTAGLRLRYEIRREFAPYVGIEWARSYGGTEDLVRAAGDDPREGRVVAGLRFWF
jgi:copper resistance protein B